MCVTCYISVALKQGYEIIGRKEVELLHHKIMKVIIDVRERRSESSLCR